MKSHYTFNMREIWKVFQGLSFLSPKVVNEPTAVSRAFRPPILVEVMRRLGWSNHMIAWSACAVVYFKACQLLAASDVVQSFCVAALRNHLKKCFGGMPTAIKLRRSHVISTLPKVANDKGILRIPKLRQNSRGVSGCSVLDS